MDRRRALAALAALGAGAASWKADAQPALLQETDLPSGEPLRDMAKLENKSFRKSGEFIGALAASPFALALAPGKAKTIAWTYGQSVPGPMIEVYEGDRVKIEVSNDLPQPTTVHWHGLHVPPSQDGLPMDAIEPGSSRTYEFDIPKDCAGMYWYHPHPHGLTAMQAARGLAGAFVVQRRGDPLGAFRRRHLMFNDLKLGSDWQVAENSAEDEMNGREGQFVLVNGQHRPVLAFDPSGMEVWFVANACNSKYLDLELVGGSWRLAGLDGGYLERPIGMGARHLLAPGQRAIFLVDSSSQAPSASLIARARERGKMGRVEPERDMLLMSVDFGACGKSPGIAWPLALRKIQTAAKPSAIKRVVLSEEMSMEGGVHSMKFLIDGKSFEMGRIDLRSKRGELEWWEVANEADMDHPFHIHGTSFQILARRAAGGAWVDEPFKAWMDTVNIASGQEVRLAMVQRHKGLRMYHCHILEHEDAGMMGSLWVD